MSIGTTFRPCALTFAPHFEQRVWGGRKLASYGRDLPEGRVIGESWEVSAIPGRASIVTRGPYKGRDFFDLLCENRDEIVGPFDRGAGAFPLLLKLIDSNTSLSVQLHPNDDEAIRLEGVGEGKLGKTEAWLILDAEPGAEVIHGLAPGVDREELFARIEAVGGDRLPEDEERSFFNRVSVRRGDVIFVPAGTIHALGAGVVLAEVQQHSDITYRIYDWGPRTPDGSLRELHIDKARQIREPDEVACPLVNLDDVKGDAPLVPVFDCDKFHFDLLRLDAGESFTSSTSDDRSSGFHLLITWDGEFEYRGSNGEEIDADPVEFILLPAALGEYRLRSPGGARAVLIRGGSRR